jgi:PilZ domain-containing protein
VPDSRVHPRYALEIDAEIRLGEQRIPARTRNVSSGGLSLIAEQAVPRGRLVTVTISLVFDEEAMSEPLPLRGRVVWCTELGKDRYQIGATFESPTREERQYVELFLRYLKEP